MKLITERDLILQVADRWREQYAGWQDAGKALMIGLMKASEPERTLAARGSNAQRLTGCVMRSTD